MNQKRRIAYEYGINSENIAEQYCLRRGDTILAKNFRVRRGEIDLILLREKFLIFLEVKSRLDAEGIHPGYSIGYKKRRSLTMAAELFLLKNPGIVRAVREMRFDLLCITGERVSEYREGIFFSTKE